MSSKSENKFRCVIIGSGTLPIRCAEILLQKGHELCCVVSPDAKVKKWAKGQRLSVYHAPKDLLANSAGPVDFLFSIVNDQILREDILSLPRKWAVNYHDAPLPRYAGTHATSWALLNHERSHGITWHLVTDLVDAGDILIQRRVEISQHETAHSLNTKCYEAATQAFGELIDGLVDGSCQPKKQNLEERTFFPRYRRPPNGAVVCWNSSARDITALVRALDFGPHSNPLGVPKVSAGDGFFVVSEIELTENEAESIPGTVNEIGPDFIRVSSADKEVVLRRFCQLDGRPLTVSNLVEKFDVTSGYRFSDLDSERLLSIEERIRETCRSESYWVKKLSALSPCSAPFSDTSTAANTAYQRRSFSPPSEFLDAVRSSDSSPSAANIIASFAGFLSRLTDNEVFDLGFLDRSQSSPFAELSSLFVEQVPIRISVDWRKPFCNLVESTRAEIEVVGRHGVFSRDLTARYAEISRSGESTMLSPLPVNVVVSHNGASGSEEVSGDISLVLGDDGSTCHFLFDEAKFSTAEIDRFLEYFTVFLNGVGDDQDCELAHIPLVGERERDLLLHGLNNNRVQVPEARCIHHLFEEQVTRTPDAIALVVGQERLTYRELDQHAELVAQRLQSLGVGPDTLVAICLERSAQMIAGILGILKAGGAYVPLDPAYPKARLDQILTDSRAEVLITQSTVSQKLSTHHNASVLLLDVEDESGTQLSRSKQSGTVGPRNLAYVIYTSGSTGKPKGVAIEHRSTVTLLAWATSVFGVEKLKGTVASTSVCFDLSVFEIFAPLCCGGKVILVENILHLPTAPARAEATLINTVPSAITELLRMKGIPDSVSTVNLAGEPLKTSLVKQIYETKTVREVFDLYGPTEDTTYSTYTLRTGGRPTIGRPIPNTQAYILDRNGQLVPPGIPGELYLGGDGLARGYLHQPNMTASRFINNPFIDDPEARIYKTGDLVRYLPSFDIEYLGRIDNQVKIRGFRIELGEVEAFLSSHPSVAEAIVIAREDQPGEKKLVAYFIGEGDVEIEVGQLRDHVRRSLPDYMTPSVFVELDEWPLTQNGKIDRKALPLPSQSLAEVNRDYVAPRNEVEAELVRIWEGLLNVRPIGVRDNFFELGGDSLISVSLFVEIERAFGVELALSVLISATTVEKLAVALQDGASPNAWKYLVPLQTQGLRLPLFCMHAAGGNVLFYRDLANELGEDQPFFGLQARGVADKTETAHDRVEDMARDYLMEIRSYQPNGPYNLCGASFGGLVAFEVAQQLIAMGEHVGTLALFDTYAPGHTPPSIAPSRSARLQSIKFRARSLKSQLDGIPDWRSRIRFVASKATKLNKKLKRKIAWAKNQFAIEYNKATGRELPANMMRNHAAIQKAMETYTPKTLDGNLLLFRASQQPTAIFDEYLGWRSFVAGEVTAIVVKGSHGALTVYPFATDLAEKLKPFLGEPTNALESPNELRYETAAA